MLGEHVQESSHFVFSLFHSLNRFLSILRDLLQQTLHFPLYKSQLWQFLAQRTLTRFGGSQCGSCHGRRWAKPKSGHGEARWKQGRVHEHRGTESYLRVCSIGVGGSRKWGCGRSRHFADGVASVPRIAGGQAGGVRWLGLGRR